MLVSVEPNVVLDPMNHEIMAWAKTKSWTPNWLSHPSAPNTDISYNFFFLIFFFNVYLFLRQRETQHEQGRGRERGRQNVKQAPGSELSAQSPTRGSNSQTCEIVTWAEVGRLTDWATQGPLTWDSLYAEVVHFRVSHPAPPSAVFTKAVANITHN